MARNGVIVVGEWGKCDQKTGGRRERTAGNSGAMGEWRVGMCEYPDSLTSPLALEGPHTPPSPRGSPYSQSHISDLNRKPRNPKKSIFTKFNSLLELVWIMKLASTSA